MVYNWTKNKGNHVTLMASDRPWFQHLNITNKDSYSETNEQCKKRMYNIIQNKKYLIESFDEQKLDKNFSFKSIICILIGIMILLIATRVVLAKKH